MNWLSIDTKSYIQEKSKEEAEANAIKFYKKGLIKSFGEAQKYIHHRERKTGTGTRKIIYYWQIECEE